MVSESGVISMDNKKIPITERVAEEILNAKKEINFQKSKAQTEEEVKGSYNKIIGNVVASTFRKYISYILNYYGYDYKVSNVNAYIKGYPTEWDLIILKSDAKETNTNVYDFNDVVAVIEFKTSGLTDKDIPGQFDKQFYNLNSIFNNTGTKIPFGYITFSETPKLYEETKKYFDENNKKSDTTFVFTNYNKLNNIDNIYYRECMYSDKNNFEDYLLKLLDL